MPCARGEQLLLHCHASHSYGGFSGGGVHLLAGSFGSEIQCCRCAQSLHDETASGKIGEEAEKVQRLRQKVKHPSTPSTYSPTAVPSVHNRTPKIPGQVPNEALLSCKSVFDALEAHLYSQSIPSHVSACHWEQSQSRVASAWVQATYSLESAFYNVLLLNTIPRFACGHLSVTQLTLYLRDAIFKALADALMSVQRRSEPALLLAVNTLAFHECVFGDLESS